MIQTPIDLESLIDKALYEDLSIGDRTTDLLIESSLQSTATLVAKNNGILAGLEACMRVFHRLDPLICITPEICEGATLKHGQVIARISGKAHSILRSERTALNFLQRTCGIATETRKYVDQVAGFNVRIIDTRKTTPGLRMLEKYAVSVGGGYNHRINLGDWVLIIDNHIQLLKRQGMTLTTIIKAAKERISHTIRIEVEVENLHQVREAIEAGAEILLLDNMSIDEMSESVDLSKGKAITEASGGININTVRAIASTGVDLISVGALTHSSKALDISLDID